MALVDDSFESYTIGQTTFATWTAFGLGGSVQHGGDLNPGSAAGDKCYRFNASGGIRHGPSEGATRSNSVTVNFSTKLNPVLGGFQPLVAGFYNRDINPPFSNVAQVAAFGLNPDGTMFVESSGKLVCFSRTSINTNEWHFVQIDLDFGSSLISGINYLSVNADIIFDGIQIADSGGAVTILATPLTNLPTGGAETNDYEFTSPGPDGGFVDNITVTSGSNHGVVFYPHGATPNTRISQAPIEIVELPNSSLVRLSQAAIELLELPTSGSVRLSQLVIELPTLGGGGGGWQIYEA